MLVHVSVALGFARLFEGTSFVRPLLGFVLGAHASPSSCGGPGSRAPSWRPSPSPAVCSPPRGCSSRDRHLGLPSTATWDAARRARRRPRPLPRGRRAHRGRPGFLLAGGLALWLAAWFADWTAHRLRAGAEAIAPAAAVFTLRDLGVGALRARLGRRVRLHVPALPRPPTGHAAAASSPGRPTSRRPPGRWSAAPPRSAPSRCSPAAWWARRSRAPGPDAGRLARRRSRRPLAGHRQPDGRAAPPAGRPERRAGVPGHQRRPVLLAPHLARSLRRRDLVERRRVPPGRRRAARCVPDDLAAPAIHQSIEIDGLAAIWAPRPSSR
ncbi:MAG: hypothetical protein R2711_16605 [Acidimicrobiales bacterium]